MIILDLEWNQGYDKTVLDEVLQIGAVRVDRLGGPITDIFCAFIRPRVHKKMKQMARYLPELRRSLDSETTFPEAMGAFLDWCGEEREFGAWGSGDMEVLAQNCRYWKMEADLSKKVWDLQRAFSITVGTGQSVALYRAVEYCGVPAPFEFHNALNDCVYTAVVSQWISPAAIDELSSPAWVKKFTWTSEPEGSSREIGPFQTARSGLNSRTSRLMSCPLCGEKGWVIQWRSRREGVYFGTFPCREHGRFLVRFVMSPGEDGLFRGRLSLPPLTDATIQAYSEAMKGQLHSCKALGGRRRRRGGRRRSGDEAREKAS
ncbi:3'-5' exonuclease [Muriventricola aceti]|uniref:3'-5' exonuclease n=1 Tax=Muriventricola aceti TaxID=2981773 RepID=UPI000821D5E7|nr:3'-5' exonuclease [Muriventricola aceti]MCU6702829.1 exonuclease domain-containing protein [Muriventricola aceti]SCJ21842.1 sporulation inhibitor KapD [uncultured Flavonifractor sp.]